MFNLAKNIKKLHLIYIFNLVVSVNPLNLHIKFDMALHKSMSNAQWSQLPKVFERRELDKGVPTTLQVTAT